MKHFAVLVCLDGSAPDDFDKGSAVVKTTAKNELYLEDKDGRIAYVHPRDENPIDMIW